MCVKLTMRPAEKSKGGTAPRRDGRTQVVGKGLPEKPTLELRLERGKGTRRFQAQVTAATNSLRWEGTCCVRGSTRRPLSGEGKMKFKHSRRKRLCLDCLSSPAPPFPAETQQGMGRDACTPDTQTLQSGLLKDNMMLPTNGVSTDFKGVLMGREYGLKERRYRRLPGR